MNKGFIVAAIVIVVGSALVCTQKLQQEEIQGNMTKMNLSENTNLVNEHELEIVSSKKIDKEYEVIVKNTSGKELDKVEFTLGEITYELYDMLPDENYKFMAYNTDDNLELKNITVDNDTVNYNSKEIALVHISTNGNVVEGAIKNNTEKYISPSQVIYFVKDKDGNTIQEIIHYETELHEENIISPNQVFGFADEIPEGLNFNNEKKVVFNYLDIESNEIKTILYEQ